MLLFSFRQMKAMPPINKKGGGGGGKKRRGKVGASSNRTLQIANYVTNLAKSWLLASRF